MRHVVPSQRALSRWVSTLPLLIIEILFVGKAMGEVRGTALWWSKFQIACVIHSKQHFNIGNNLFFGYISVMLLRCSGAGGNA